MEASRETTNHSSFIEQGRSQLFDLAAPFNETKGCPVTVNSYGPARSWKWNKTQLFGMRATMHLASGWLETITVEQQPVTKLVWSDEGGGRRTAGAFGHEDDANSRHGSALPTLISQLLHPLAVVVHGRWGGRRKGHLQKLWNKPAVNSVIK